MKLTISSIYILSTHKHSRVGNLENSAKLNDNESIVLIHHIPHLIKKDKDKVSILSCDHTEVY